MQNQKKRGSESESFLEVDFYLIFVDFWPPKPPKGGPQNLQNLTFSKKMSTFRVKKKTMYFGSQNGPKRVPNVQMFVEF